MGIGFVVAAAVGIGVAVQVAVLGRSADTADPLAASLALQLSGVAAGVVWATGRGAWSEVAVVSRTWWWVPLGVGGWIVVAALGFASNRIGVAPVLAVSVAAQLAAGLGIDTAVGTAAVRPGSVLGLGLIIGGVMLVVTHS